MGPVSAGGGEVVVIGGGNELCVCQPWKHFFKTSHKTHDLFTNE